MSADQPRSRYEDVLPSKMSSQLTAAPGTASQAGSGHAAMRAPLSSPLPPPAHSRLPQNTLLRPVSPSLLISLPMTDDARQKTMSPSPLGRQAL